MEKWYICSVLRSTVSISGWSSASSQGIQAVGGSDVSSSSYALLRDWFIPSHLLAVLLAHGHKTDEYAAEDLAAKLCALPHSTAI